MGESEGRTVNVRGKSESLKSILKDQTLRQASLRAVSLPVGSSAESQPYPAHNYTPPAKTSPKRWNGTATEFACKIQDDWNAGSKLKAKNLTAALQQACHRYIQKNGKPFSPHSLRELLRKLKYKRDGNPL